MASNQSPDPTTARADGTVEEIGGRYVLRFERRLPHPVETVWDALTRPERLRDWFGEVEVKLELVVVRVRTGRRRGHGHAGGHRLSARDRQTAGILARPAYPRGHSTPAQGS